MQRQGKKFCANLSIAKRFAFMNGEFSYVDYFDYLIHCDICQYCCLELEKMEEEVFKERPLFHLEYALRRQSTDKCLCEADMNRLVKGDAEFESSKFLYAQYHLCFCSRCYALFCQSLVIKSAEASDYESIVIPANTLNEKMLYEIVGPQKYSALRNYFEIEPAGTIYDYLIKRELLNNVLLTLKYEKKREHRLAFVSIDGFDFYVDGIELVK